MEITATEVDAKYKDLTVFKTEEPNNFYSRTWSKMEHRISGFTARICNNFLFPELFHINGEQKIKYEKEGRVTTH